MKNIDFLQVVQKDIWVSEQKFGKLRLKEARELGKIELFYIEKIINEEKLVTQMCTSGMICGYGMVISNHPIFPGAPLEMLLYLTEKHLPLNTWRKSTNQGQGRDDSWELFSKFTHSEQNKTWLKMYNLPFSQSRESYDY